MKYNPPCNILTEILSQVVSIAEAVGRRQATNGINLRNFAIRLRDHNNPTAKAHHNKVGCINLKL